MPIDPFYRLLIKALGQMPAESGAEQGTTEFLHSTGKWASPDVEVEDISIRGPHGAIGLRTYRPVHRQADCALLWVHGGGFASGSLDMDEAHMVSGELARRARAFVVSVDYRLATDGIRYPIPLDDVYAAWFWLRTLRTSSAELNAVPLALGGASAGAALALATALRDRDEGTGSADMLLLAYPFVHFPVPALDEATAQEMRTLPASGRFSPPVVEHMVRNYVGRISDLPADALPGGARLNGLPATYLVLSQYDDLRPSGELLQRQLEEAGVPVTAFLARGMLHGHLVHFSEPLAQTEQSLDFFTRALNNMSSPWE